MTVEEKAKTEQPIDQLMAFLEEVSGLSATQKKRVYKTLLDFGITHPLAFKNRTVKELTRIDGISENVAEKIVEHANPSKKGETLFKSLAEVKEEEEKSVMISTGSKRLDELLGGGITLGTLVEFYGSPQSGKTQLCYTLAANTLLDLGGVLWLDTEGSFRSSRLEQILFYLEEKKEKKVDEEKKKAINNQFNVATVRTLAQLELALQHAEKVITVYNVKLLVVDSLMDVFRAEYGGLGELAERQKHLNVVIHKMMKLADAYNVAVVYTNQVMANPDPFATAMDKVQPVGGFVLGHASDIRVWLRRATSAVKKKYEAPNARRAMITDCGWLPMEETIFSIGAYGICDVEEEGKMGEYKEENE